MIELLACKAVFEEAGGVLDITVHYEPSGEVDLVFPFGDEAVTLFRPLEDKWVNDE